MSDSFGARLRAARERRCITLATIAHSTKINKALFEGLERDDMSRWPTGIFRRAFIRAYADAVGLDADAIVTEFLQRFPEAGGEPRPAGAAASRKDVVWHDSLAAEPPEMRLMFVEEPSPIASRHHRPMDGWSTRAMAASFDFAVVALLGAGFAIVGRFSTGFPVATVLYYIAGLLTFGNSPGAWLVGRSRDTRAGAHQAARTFTPRLVSRHARHTTSQRNDPRAAEHAAASPHNSRGAFTVSRRMSN